VDLAVYQLSTGTTSTPFSVSPSVEVTQLITCASIDPIAYYESVDYVCNNPMVSSSIATPVIRNSNGEEVVDPLVTCAVTTSIKPPLPPGAI